MMTGQSYRPLSSRSRRTALLSAGLLVPLLSAGLLAGCASPPQRDAAVDALRTRLSRAQEDSATRQAAADQLQKADQALSAADVAFQNDDNPLSQHELYLADRALRTAEAEGAAATARQQTAQLQQEMQSRQHQQAMLNTRQTPEGQLLTLYDLPFATGKATLQPGARTQLDPVVAYLREHPGQHVIIRGNTDSVGSAERNQELSQERADAVMAYLTTAGVPSSQITTEGLGEDYPVASNSTPSGRARNRRVDVVIQNPPPGGPATAQLPEAPAPQRAY